jgi:UDP-N-acetylmuramoyl-tripeptide--D-alanyl-D-alanine ligase
VIGVTGSVGKTSTKDFIASALGATRRVAANVKSFNNEQGLPVTILGAPDDVEVLVVEMGMRGFGEIARLCEVARPTVGVVTRVAASHTERVGGIEGVAVAKRELVESLPPTGVAVLNADDDRVAAMAAVAPGDVLTFGRGRADIWVEHLVLDELARARFRVVTPWGSADVELAASGEHMAMNAAAAIAVSGIVEGSIDAAVEALAGALVSGMRMEVSRAPSGALVVNDAYNANPDSMRAALDALASMAATRRFAILGPMAELDDPVAGHLRVMDDAREHGIEVIATSTSLYGVEPADDPIAALGPIGPGDVVLVKASRSGGLERFVEQLMR